MQAELIDPRDSMWEEAVQSFRVNLWTPNPDSDLREPEGGYSCATYRLTGTSNVREMLDWAEDHAEPGDTIEVLVETRRDEELGLIRIAGTDPMSNL